MPTSATPWPDFYTKDRRSARSQFYPPKDKNACCRNITCCTVLKVIIRRLACHLAGGASQFEESHGS
jgi:hypothetical protein